MSRTVKNEATSSLNNGKDNNKNRVINLLMKSRGRPVKRADLIKAAYGQKVKEDAEITSKFSMIMYGLKMRAEKNGMEIVSEKDANGARVFTLRPVARRERKAATSKARGNAKK